jgi:signal transduction histidine kinase
VEVTRFTVIDTGRGIKPDDQHMLFAAFKQIDATATHPHDGIGLGLCISRRLATAIGGAITLESEFGNGSNFTLEVPLAQGALPRPRTVSAPASHIVGG